MEPIDTYLMYCAMKAHFGKGNYDFVKYDGKTKVSRDSFWKRKDRHFFVKLAKKYDNPKDYFIANFIKDTKGYIANFNDENYDSWKLRRQGFFEMFAVEMYPFISSFNPIFEVVDGNHPILLKEYLGKRISLETLIILDVLVDYAKVWDVKLEGDVIWPDLRKLMKDYKRFLTIDANKYKMKLLNLIEESSHD